MLTSLILCAALGQCPGGTCTAPVRETVVVEKQPVVEKVKAKVKVKRERRVLKRFRAF